MMHLPKDNKKQTKICSRCARELPLLLFHKRTASKDGYKRICVECVRDYAKAYRQRDVVRIKEAWRHSRRRAEAVGIKPTYTLEEFTALYLAFDECGICGAEFDENNRPTIDHIKPLSMMKEGEKDDISNLIVSCPRCNVRRGSTDIINYFYKVHTIDKQPELFPSYRLGAIIAMIALQTERSMSEVFYKMAADAVSYRVQEVIRKIEKEVKEGEVR